MQIKKLELSGFKSFMNPVALEYGGGITAILGPNGCGKSNVVDALRWVLGEQSAKQLRGEKMLNVVFGGTRTRKPLSMAEVSITFNNLDGRIPTPYQEVRITRRLTRDGQSDYLLNGVPCRLKDVRDLITDTGAGSHAYSIIEREMVDGVIQGHDDSRRFLLEEASGIMKYRMRRREAERKLEMTSQDLLRLDDIIAEIERNVRALRRQMGRAERWQELHTELRRAETWLAQSRLHGYRDAETRLRAQLEDLQAASVGEDAESAGIDARIAGLRAEMAETERAWREAGERGSGLADRLRAEEESILVLGQRMESTREAQAAARGEIEAIGPRLTQVRQDRAALESRREELEHGVAERRESFLSAKAGLEACEERYEASKGGLLQVKQRTFDFARTRVARQGEIDVLRAKMETLGERAREQGQAARDAASRAARLAEELAALRRQLEAVTAKRDERRATHERLEHTDEELVGKLEAQREARADLRTQLDAQRSRAELLRALVAAYEGYGQGPRSLLERHGTGAEVLGSLADLVHAPAELEAAFAALLHDVLDALVVRDIDAGLDLVGELRQNGLGHATFLVPAVHPAPADPELAELRNAPGVVGLAVDLLPLGGPAGESLRRLLAQAVVVEDAAAGRRVLARSADARLRIATRDGLLLTGAGMLRGGGGTEPDVGLLGRQARLREVEERVQELERQVERATADVACTESELRACRSERRDVEQALRDNDAEVVQLSLTQASLGTAFEECNDRCGQAQRALGEVEAEQERLDRMLPELTEDAERLATEGDAQGKAVAELEAQFEAIEGERERQRHEAAELRVAFVELRGESESCARQAERLAELERELGELRTRRQEEIERAARDLDTWTADVAGARQRAASLAAELEAARAAQNEVGLRLGAQRAELEGEQSRLHAAEKERREHQGRMHTVEMQLSESRMHAGNLVERVREAYELGESELLALTFEWSDADPVPDDDRVRDLRAALARLGPVNLLALEEFEEKSKRLHFLEEQRRDLAQASTALQETIDKINRTACFLFLETFDQVRTHFRDTIRTVFEGGEGDLVLTNPEDPLETDVELRVRPRGKKIETLTQLSSGERALTAIALLFSIYLVKPSPFCVFDEVDAPLDDANVLRFVNLLENFKDRTQFIVITHNKLTMEAADCLYGVTMEEEGVSKLVSVALDGKVRGQPRMLRRHADRAARIAAVLQPASAVVEAAPNGGSGAHGEGSGKSAGVGNRKSIGNGGKGGNGNAAGESRAPAARLERPQGAARPAARIGPEHRRTAPEERGTPEESAGRDPALIAALDNDAAGAEEEPLV